MLLASEPGLPAAIPRRNASAPKADHQFAARLSQVRVELQRADTLALQRFQQPFFPFAFYRRFNMDRLIEI